VLKYGNVETNKHTNIILMEVPHRYDLMQDLCVNKEVGKFNSKLRKCIKTHGNAEVIKVNSERKYYTKHGQHTNVIGKELMAKNIIEAVKHLLKPRKKTPIVMKWKNEGNNENQNTNDDKNAAEEEGRDTVNINESIQVVEKTDRLEEEETEVLTSKRSRKIPVTRSSDFLWLNTSNKEKIPVTRSKDFLW
jgi:hypothetical protein